MKEILSQEQQPHFEQLNFLFHVCIFWLSVF